MNKKQQILQIILLLVSIAYSNIENYLFTEKIEGRIINLSFNFSEDFDDKNNWSKNEFGYPAFNYLLSLPHDNIVNLKYVSNSNHFLKNFNNEKNHFIEGIKKNENKSLNEDHVYISEKLIIDKTEYVVLTINPIKLTNNQFRIYNNIEIQIELSEDIYDFTILNTSEASSILTREAIDYESPVLLIIAPEDNNILNLMNPFINWKKSKGYTVLYHTLNQTGYTNTEIKSFIQNLYNNGDYPPNYICLVGDADGPYAIPTFNENLSIYNGETDHPYTLLNGNDNISDVSIGRLSIRSLGDLATITNKIINYEQYPYLSDNNWFEKALCVGDSAISGLSAIITNQIIAELMVQYGYNYVIEVYQYPFVNQIENSINSGVSFYNYRGFSGSSGWQKDSADNLNNGYMLPFASVITCDTGSFLEDEESISENFLRAGSISIPKGGIAAVGMSTQGTHTMFNNCLDYGLYHGIFVEKINTIGDAVNYAKNNLLLNYPNNPNNYIDIFSHWINLMGDPTLSLWTEEPKELSLILDETIPIGQNSINIISNNIEGPVGRTKISITDSSFNLVAHGITNELGELILNWDVDSLPIGTYNVVGTKKNYIPFRSEFNINETSSSINLIDFHVSSQSDSQIIIPGEMVDVKFKIKNYGTDTINNVGVDISINDEYVNLINQEIMIDDISSYELSDEILFSATINSDILKRDIEGEIIITHEDIIWSFPFSFLVSGAEINIDDFDTNGEDNFLSPGDNSINLIFHNNGEINSREMEINLFSNHIFLNLNETIIIPEIDSNESYVASLDLFINSGAYPGLQIPVNVSYIINGESMSQKIFIFPIGEVGYSDPSGPDEYGYYIYDFNDYGYSLRPNYNWIEIDPYFEGNGTILIDLNDDGENQDDVTFINLPFDFKFYGQDYQQISISTNGWLKPGLTNQSSFRNWRLPGPGGPSPMIAAFWDDLQTSSGRICVQYDSDNNWYIIEWSSIQNGFDGSEETFQIIIYDQEYYPTLTGDNMIKIQYKEFNNVNSGHYDTYNQWHGNYASVGIENSFSNIGLEYSWNNQYLNSASILENESAILITTDSPSLENYLLGDVNQDNQLNILDVINIIQSITDNQISGDNLILSDMNQDGNTNILDVIVLVNIIIEV